MGKKLDLAGQKFGRLTVIEEAGRNKRRNVLWKCRCDCGNECVVSSIHLRRGNTISCGCYNRERVTKHGLCSHPLYAVWGSLLQRTGVHKGADDEKRRAYIDRGISVCAEWHDFGHFAEWALSHGYEKGLQIDRIDNDRGYCPDNCRWVTPKQNMNNRRNTLLICGCPLAVLCSDLGIVTLEDGHPTNIYTRIAMYHKAHKGQKVHRDLVFAMLRDIEKQEQLLDETRSKRKRAEAELERLKALLNS